MIHAIRKPDARSVSVLWLNAAETWVDIDNKKYATEGKKINTHWMSESGVIDIFVFPGRSIQDNLNKYTQLTGRPMLPPMFSIAYHQCRWNYNDEADVESVDSGFDKWEIPYDVLWLDIEHTDGKRYFTWDKQKFPNPSDMQNEIAKKLRKMVAIVDPHFKVDNDYPVYKDASSENLLVKTADGKPFEGWCWPGISFFY